MASLPTLEVTDGKTVLKRGTYGTSQGKHLTPNSVFHSLFCVSKLL